MGPPLLCFIKSVLTRAWLLSLGHHAQGTGHFYFPLTTHFSINNFSHFPNHAEPKVVRMLCTEGFLRPTTRTVWPLLFLGLKGHRKAGKSSHTLRMRAPGTAVPVLEFPGGCALSCADLLWSSVPLCLGVLSHTDPHPSPSPPLQGSPTHHLAPPWCSLPRTCGPHRPPMAALHTPCWCGTQGSLPCRAVPAHLG